MTPERFRTLAVAELAPMHRFARCIARDEADADDLVQQTFVRAFEAWTTFVETPAGIRPWLFKILHNTHRARVRSRTERTDSRIDERTEDPEAGGPGDAAPGVGPINWDAVDDQLKHAIQTLPDDLREVFLLHAGEDLKYREIAEVMQIPVGTVMSRLSRARKRLLLALRPDPARGGNNPPEVRIVSKGGAARRHD